MKIYHLADLHFGKSIYGLSMLDDQRYWADQFLHYCSENKPDAVVIAGDVYDRSARREKRPVKEIGLSAVRGGTIVGDHDVIFAGQDEVITLSHRAYSRAVFGKGAVEAAKFLAGKEAGFYTMGDVLS